jgi:hypothetical protein
MEDAGYIADRDSGIEGADEIERAGHGVDPCGREDIGRERRPTVPTGRQIS